jgi:hypothetical protein
MSDWSFDSREIADRWLRDQPDRRHIIYGYVLFVAGKSGP